MLTGLSLERLRWDWGLMLRGEDKDKEGEGLGVFGLGTEFLDQRNLFHSWMSLPGHDMCILGNELMLKLPNSLNPLETYLPLGATSLG